MTRIRWSWPFVLAAFLASCEKASPLPKTRASAKAASLVPEPTPNQPHRHGVEITAMELSRALGFNWWELEVPSDSVYMLYIRIDGPSGTSLETLTGSTGWEAGDTMKLGMRTSRDETEIDVTVFMGATAVMSTIENPFRGLVRALTNGRITGDAVLIRGRKGSSITMEPEPDDVTLSIEWGTK